VDLFAVGSGYASIGVGRNGGAVVNNPSYLAFIWLAKR
jgi:hypothetical protein